MTAAPADSRAWLRTLAPRPSAKFRLYLFPHAGGGPVFFRDWPAAIGPDVELVAIQLPGREGRIAEPPLRDFNQVISTVSAEIARTSKTPFAFFGHSFGAIVALETLRELQRQAASLPRALIVSGARAPQLTAARASLNALSDADLREELSRLGGTPREILNNDEIFQVMLPPLRADLMMFEQYRNIDSPLIDTPLLALGGQTDECTSVTELCGWQDVTSARFECQTFAGGHFYLTKARIEIAATITKWLEDGHVMLQPGEVDLWLLPLEQPIDAGAEDALSETERQRAERFLRPRDRNRYVATRYMTRTILSRHLDTSPDAVRFVIGPHGKPELAPDQADDLHFNVSHSDDFGLLAIARHELGVDIEAIRGDVDIDGIATRFFSRPERRHLLSLKSPHRRQCFFDIWAGKEAYCKARGLGLHLPTDTYSVLPAASSPWAVDDSNATPSDRSNVYPLFIAPDYAAAVASSAPVNRIHIRDWLRSHL